MEQTGCGLILFGQKTPKSLIQQGLEGSTTLGKDEVRKQFQIRGWSEETRQVILAALEYYKCAEGLAKIRG